MLPLPGMVCGGWWETGKGGKRGGRAAVTLRERVKELCKGDTENDGQRRIPAGGGGGGEGGVGGGWVGGWGGGEGGGGGGEWGGGRVVVVGGGGGGVKNSPGQLKVEKGRVKQN